MSNWWTMTREEFEARKVRQQAAREVGFPYQGMDIVMPSSKGDKPVTKDEMKEYFDLARAQRKAFLDGLVGWADAINMRQNG